MPHIPKAKSDKMRESPTYWGLEELPIWWWSPTYPGMGGVGQGLLWLVHKWYEQYPVGILDEVVEYKIFVTQIMGTDSSCI